MSSDWIEITASGPRKRSEEAGAVLIGAGSSGVLEVEGDSPEVGRLLSHSLWESGGSTDSLDETRPLSRTVSFKAYLAADDSIKIERVKKDLKKLPY